MSNKSSLWRDGRCKWHVIMMTNCKCMFQVSQIELTSCFINQGNCLLIIDGRIKTMSLECQSMHWYKDTENKLGHGFLYGCLSPLQILTCLRNMHSSAVFLIQQFVKFQTGSPHKTSSLFASRAPNEHSKFQTEQRHHYLPLGPQMSIAPSCQNWQLKKYTQRM